MSLNNCSGPSLVGLASSLAIFISESLSNDEISTLAAFFSALGDNLAIIANQKSLQDDCKN